MRLSPIKCTLKKFFKRFIRSKIIESAPHKSSSKEVSQPPTGILLVDKESGLLSFQLVKMLRRRLGVAKVGHSGTLDPNASGLMVMLIGREYTRLSESLTAQHKRYRAVIRLGQETNTYDCDGEILAESSDLPDFASIQKAIEAFEGWSDQVPPMHSAKKIGGQTLYNLARRGIEIERAPVRVWMSFSQIEYRSPDLIIEIHCSKGTYIRSFAHDLGRALGCGAHLKELCRTASGEFLLEQAIPSRELLNPDFPLLESIRVHSEVAKEVIEKKTIQKMGE
ncbi:MAG: tRNA pseudouridine(55) synthase TruB [Chlamydiia bacterium]|nr:tRNA pseudouridine(55) synthase TruB [Chlamydiia bacterium]